MAKIITTVIVFSVITIAWTLAWIYFLMMKHSAVITTEMKEFEYNKYGWRENYEFVIKQQKEYTDKVIAQMKWAPQANDSWEEVAKAPEVTVPEILTNEQISSMIDWNYILWDKNAKINFIEYSDLECPFCKRLHESGTIARILDNYWEQVNYTFKHYPLDFHKWAQKKSHAVFCAWELGWNEKYFEMMEEIFKTWPEVADLGNTASNIWISKEEFASCMESWKYNEKITSELNEGQSMWVRWTPGNILINIETGAFEILEGAYPYSDFETRIKKLLWE